MRTVAVTSRIIGWGVVCILSMVTLVLAVEGPRLGYVPWFYHNPFVSAEFARLEGLPVDVPVYSNPDTYQFAGLYVRPFWIFALLLTAAVVVISAAVLRPSSELSLLAVAVTSAGLLLLCAEIGFFGWMPPLANYQWQLYCATVAGWLTAIWRTSRL